MTPDFRNRRLSRRNLKRYVYTRSAAAIGGTEGRIHGLLPSACAGPRLLLRIGLVLFFGTGLYFVFF